MTKQELTTVVTMAVELALNFSVEGEEVIVHSKVPGIADSQYWEFGDFYESEVMGAMLIAGRF